jgi:hypothetical protein
VRIITFVTEYLLPLLACPCCGKINAAKAPPWAYPGSVSYGPGINTAAVLLTSYGNVPAERTANLIGMLLGALGAIDALDECPENNGTRESFLAEIRKLQTNIHLLITSRHISTIEREFEKVAQVGIQASGEDIRRYLEGWIESGGRLVCLIKVDLALQATIVNIIVENAKGM